MMIIVKIYNMDNPSKWDCVVSNKAIERHCEVPDSYRETKQSARGRAKYLNAPSK